MREKRDHQAATQSGRAASGLTDAARQLPSRIALLCLAGDAMVVVTSLIAAFWLRFRTDIQHFGVASPGLTLGDYWGYILFGTIALLGVLGQRQMYQPSRLLRRHTIHSGLFITCLIWGAGFLGFSLFFKFQPSLSRVYTIIALITVITGLHVWRRYLGRWLCQDAVVAKLRQRILVVGWTEQAQRLKRAIQSDPAHAYEVVCCVPPRAGRFHHAPPRDILVGEDYGEISSLLNSETIDIVLVADQDLPNDDLCELTTLCEKELVQFKLVPACFNVLTSGLHLETISGVPLLGVSRLPLHNWFNQLVKRALDIVGATIGLVVSAPLIAVFGVLVYLESSGPIIYRQRRVGRNGKEFEMLKIRSMRLDAEKDGRVGWSTKGDSRRLRIGAFMRKWNIDEVPQFWNVLKGDMSLVGPRPERPELIRGFKDQIAHYNARHVVKPGLTGWAQVSGLRGDTDLSERIRHDLFYMENWSILFDLRLMLLTFFNRKGAC